ncbi:MAG TPA: lysophospholipid acyltransferase family protein [Lachnospiraceae bacterium]|nr:lysophospholipid acyltransferase family protein [Lachnospiraceae bacterium]
MLRLIIGIIFVILYLLVSCPIMLVMLIIRIFNRTAAETAMLRIVQWAFKVVWHIAGVRVTTIGLENVPDDEAVLFVGNHQSFFDVIISYSQMKNRTGYIAKDSISHVPILTWNMRFLRCLFIDRKNLRKGVRTILKAADYVNEGISIFIFPEGTRNKSGDETALAPFHDGSFKIAQRSGCPVIPVSFNNTETIFERHLPWIQPQHVVIEYGKPQYFKDLSHDDRKHVGAYFQNVIKEMVKKNQPLV